MYGDYDYTGNTRLQQFLFIRMTTIITEKSLSHLILIIPSLFSLNTFVSFIMVKQLAVIFLLFAFSAQVFNRAVIMLDYYANPSSFSKNCENKSRPMMHCNGQCQMMKKIKEEENKEKSNPGRRAENKDEVVSSKSFFAIVNIRQLLHKQLHAPCINRPVPEGIRNAVFHPPGLV
jgi:hypothetical protein